MSTGSDKPSSSPSATSIASSAPAAAAAPAARLSPSVCPCNKPTPPYMRVKDATAWLSPSPKGFGLVYTTQSAASAAACGDSGQSGACCRDVTDEIHDVSSIVSRGHRRHANEKQGKGKAARTYQQRAVRQALDGAPVDLQRICLHRHEEVALVVVCGVARVRVCVWCG